jgi:phosphatidylinositol-3-phosphatase
MSTTGEGSLKRLLIGGAALCAALAVSALASASSPNSANAHLKHVFVIVLENHSQTSVIGDPNAPFLTSLAHTYGMASQYYGVTHPSEPNYVAMITGSNQGINDDSPAHVFDVPNLVDQLEATGHSWDAYMESLPSVGFTGTQFPANASLYVNKHDPFVLMQDVRSNPSRLAHVKPYTDLASDLSSGNAADFSFIVPNQCHDMHGGVFITIAADHSDGTPCPFGSTKDDANEASLKQKADAFVQQTVTTIMSSKAWTGNSAIFIVSDENDFTGNAATDGWESAAWCCDSPILPDGFHFLNSAGLPDGNVWHGQNGDFHYGGGLSPAIVVTTTGPRGYVSDVPYNHYSLLTTIEQNWGLGFLGHAGDTAGGVVPMNDLLVHNG